VIRQHRPDPRPPDFRQWTTEFQEFVAWSRDRHLNPDHLAHHWDSERIEAHVAQTWPAVRQATVWQRWHDEQPARQGPRLQVRGKTVARSAAWLAVYAVVFVVAAVNIFRAADHGDTLLLIVNGFVLGALITNGFWRAVGLKYQLHEQRGGTPTNREQMMADYRAAVRRGDAGDFGDLG
jgi:hypothetical protein